MLRPAKPAQQLRRFVRKYVHVESSLVDSQFWPIPARSVTCIEFTFGDPYRIHATDGSAFEVTHPTTIIGAKTRQRIRLELHGRVEAFAILFEPTGLQRLFSLPGTTIVNEHYEANTVLGPSLKQLWMQLGEAKSFAHRFQTADVFLTRLIPRIDGVLPLDAAVQHLVSHQGCVRIFDLARHTGLGLRQFERQFVDVVGISPKLYARIVRFEAAVRKKTVSVANWTTIAHELGYHDQMHMIHDFQVLSGENPSSLTPHLEYLSSLAAEPQA